MAFLGDYFIRSHHWKPCVIALAGSITVILTILAVCGYLGKNEILDGYGYASINLLSPFYRGRFSPKGIDATGGQQFDRFNYLGIGLMAALVITGILHWRWLIHLPRHYPVLTVIVCLLTIFALSNKVFWGSKELIHYDLFYPLQMIGGTFRVSGRMFWPVGYLLMLVGLLGVLRNRNHAMVVPGLLLERFPLKLKHNGHEGSNENIPMERRNAGESQCFSIKPEWIVRQHSAGRP